MIDMYRSPDRRITYGETARSGRTIAANEKTVVVVRLRVVRQQEQERVVLRWLAASPGGARW